MLSWGMVGTAPAGTSGNRVIDRLVERCRLSVRSPSLPCVLDRLSEVLSSMRSDRSKARSTHYVDRWSVSPGRTSTEPGLDRMVQT